MRWGVRRKDPSSDGEGAVTVRSKKGKGIVKVSGGAKREASDDAVKAAAYKQKAKASTTDSLTNDELKALVARLQLEQQYAKLTNTPSRLDKGQNKVKTLLSVGSTANDIITFANSPAGKALKKQLKKVK
jgi:hypothetical protein